jgi:hypothetical protein
LEYKIKNLNTFEELHMKQLLKKLASLLFVTSMSMSGNAWAAFDVWDGADPWNTWPAYYAGWDVFSLTANYDNIPDMPGSGAGTFVTNVSGSTVLSDGNLFAPPNSTDPAYILRLATDPFTYYDVYVRLETLRTNPDTMTAVINFTNDDGSITQYFGVQTVSYVSDPTQLGTANEQEYSWKFSMLPAAYAYIVNISQNSSPYTIVNLAEIAAIPLKIVTPVPEPESYAMMFFGLVLIGLIARKKKSF